MRCCEGRKRKATLDEPRDNGIWTDIQLYVLRPNCVTGNADVRQSRFGTERKWRWRSLRKKSFVGCKTFVRPVPAPRFDGMSIGTKGLGEVISNTRRDEGMRVCNGHERQRTRIGPFPDVLWNQSWCRMDLVEIFDDCKRLKNGVPLMNECRDDPFGVDSRVGRLYCPRTPTAR